MTDATGIPADEADGDGLPPPDGLERYLLSGRAPPHAMTRAGIDGLLTAAILTPDTIPRDEWEPLVWGDADPVFADEEEKEDVEHVFETRMAAIVVAMGDRRGRLLFRPDFGARTDIDAAGRDWAEGFLDGIGLRRDAWEPLAHSRRSSNLLELLADMAYPPPDLPPDAIAPRLVLSALVGEIAEFWDRQAAARPRGPKTGRNDPCPCGSGRKYKRCCGQG